MPSPRTIQTLLGSIFLVLGGWALLFAADVERLVLAPEHFVGTTASAVLMGCFGAQACLCATVILTCRFTPLTFLAFGLVGSLPFFAFNFYFLYIEPIFTNWMYLDFVGNIGILSCGVLGWYAARQELASTQVHEHVQV